MLRIIMFLLVIAALAALFGFGGLSGTAASAASFIGWLLVAKVVLSFVALWLVGSFVMGMFKGNKA